MLPGRQKGARQVDTGVLDLMVRRAGRPAFGRDAVFMPAASLRAWRETLAGAEVVAP